MVDTRSGRRGCSFAHLRPGILSRYGPLLREPFGRVHWAGTETATTSHGAIDGAVRSGERAAAEILDRVGADGASVDADGDAARAADLAGRPRDGVGVAQLEVGVALQQLVERDA